MREALDGGDTRTADGGRPAAVPKPFRPYDRVPRKGTTAADFQGKPGPADVVRVSHRHEPRPGRAAELRPRRPVRERQRMTRGHQFGFALIASRAGPGIPVDAVRALA